MDGVVILRRGVDPATLAAFRQGSYPVLFAWLDWPDAAVWAHSGVGIINWGGRAWRGVGTVGNVQIPEEGAEIAAVEAILSLAGVPADLDGYADDAIRNRSVMLYIGAVRGRPGGASGKEMVGLGNTLVGEPVQLFSGIMDMLTLTASATDEGVEHEAQVTVLTGQEARSMASLSHSDEDQRRRYPADTAGRHTILAYAKAQKMHWPET